MRPYIESIESDVAFDFDFRRGHYTERKTGITPTVNAPAKMARKKGRYGIYTSGAGRVFYPDNAAFRLESTERTVLAFGDFTTPRLYRPFSRRDSGGVALDFYASVGPERIGVYDGTTDSTLNVSLSGRRMLGFTHTDGYKPVGYVDGALAGTFSGNITVPSRATTVDIGNSFAGDSPLRDVLWRVIGFSRILTDEEIRRIYEDMMLEASETSVLPDIRRTPLRAKTATAPVIEYDFISKNGRNFANLGSGGPAYDLVRGNGTSQGRGCFGPALHTDGVDGAPYTANTVTDLQGVSKAAFELVMDWYAAPANKYQVSWGNGLGATFFGMYADGGNMAFFANNGAGTSGSCARTSGARHHIHVQYDGTLSGNANRLKAWVDGVPRTLTFVGTIPATLGSTGTALYLMNYLGQVPQRTLGAMSYFRLWSGYVPTETERARMYREYASTPIADAMLDRYPVQQNGAIAEMLNPNWRLPCPLRLGTDGIKAFNNTGGGIFADYMRDPYAFGSWRFKWSVASLSAGSHVQLVCADPVFSGYGSVSAAGGYMVYVFSDGSVKVLQTAGGSSADFTSSSTGIVQAGILYDFVVTRDYAASSAQWNLYIKGGAYSSWTLVGSGSNATYVTCRSFGFYAGAAADRFGGFVHYQGALSPITYPELYA